jgi:hypothetical protein
VQPLVAGGVMHISTWSAPGVSNTRVYFSSVSGSTKMTTVVARPALADASSAIAIASRNRLIDRPPVAWCLPPVPLNGELTADQMSVWNGVKSVPTS